MDPIQAAAELQRQIAAQQAALEAQRSADQLLAEQLRQQQGGAQ